MNGTRRLNRHYQNAGGKYDELVLIPDSIDDWYYYGTWVNLKPEHLNPEPVYPDDYKYVKAKYIVVTIDGLPHGIALMRPKVHGSGNADRLVFTVDKRDGTRKPIVSRPDTAQGMALLRYPAGWMLNNAEYQLNYYSRNLVNALAEISYTFYWNTFYESEYIRLPVNGKPNILTINPDVISTPCDLTLTPAQHNIILPITIGVNLNAVGGIYLFKMNPGTYDYDTNGRLISFTPGQYGNEGRVTMDDIRNLKIKVELRSKLTREEREDLRQWQQNS